MFKVLGLLLADVSVLEVGGHDSALFFAELVTVTIFLSAGDVDLGPVADDAVGDDVVVPSLRNRLMTDLELAVSGRFKFVAFCWLGGGCSFARDWDDVLDDAISLTSERFDFADVITFDVRVSPKTLFELGARTPLLAFVPTLVWLSVAFDGAVLMPGFASGRVFDGGAIF